ncbi:MAG: hypothetical protein ABMA64_01195 [Myxococcota bacterium]
MIPLLAGCHRTTEPPPPPPADSAITDSAPPADSAPTGDTGEPCTPTDEIIADGVDQDCDGWADELGLGQPATEAAQFLYLGDTWHGLGQSVDLGTDHLGTSWLALGGLSRALAEVAPVDGTFELSVAGTETYDEVGYELAIVNWEAGFLVSGDPWWTSLELFDGVGAQVNREDSVAELRPVYTAGMEAADLDADGIDEILFGGGSTLSVYDEPVAGVFTRRLLVESVFPPSQNFAYQVGEVGDLTGDGQVEITAYREDDDIGGRAFILPGDLSGTVLDTDVGWSLAGEEPEGQAGFSIALGDIDGDGYLDLVTGAFLAQRRGGVSYVVQGPIPTDGFLADGLARFEPLRDNDWCGVAVETLPDQDGDGTDEVAIACPRDRYGGVDLPGRVELYAGGRVGGTLDATSADRVLVGAGAEDLFGLTMSADGDATGDGAWDLAVGAPGDVQGAEASGAVYVFAAPLL